MIYLDEEVPIDLSIDFLKEEFKNNVIPVSHDELFELVSLCV